MDKIDKKILELLQADSHISNQDLADRVALSPSPCLRRVNQLESEEYIKGYVALLNPEKLGLSLVILVSVGLDTHDPKKMANFEKTIQSFPEVVDCYLITGQSHDYLLKVMMNSLSEYHAFLLNRLTQIAGVKTVHSSFALRTVVNKTALPLMHVT